MSKLYDIGSRYRNIQELLDNPKFPNEEIKKTFDGIDEEFNIKVENITKFIRSMKVDAEGINDEIKRLQDRKRVLENRVEALKRYVYDQMNSVGKKKIQGKLFTLAIQKNPKQVIVRDSKSIPQKYLVPQEPKIDKELILQDIKIGMKVNGVDITQNESLRIR
ncbi:siphovirus Gp157 family protein [Clostridium tyrobutyricum]|uniref:siphovirus Gp157 family protein n=1 Tax=Clostridium tyrobutyricum TaxID=1519 RepID=UPI0030CEE797